MKLVSYMLGLCSLAIPTIICMYTMTQITHNIADLSYYDNSFKTDEERRTDYIIRPGKRQLSIRDKDLTGLNIADNVLEWEDDKQVVVQTQNNNIQTAGFELALHTNATDVFTSRSTVQPIVNITSNYRNNYTPNISYVEVHLPKRQVSGNKESMTEPQFVNNQTLYAAKSAMDKPQLVNNQSLYDAKAANDRPQPVNNQTLYDAKAANDRPQPVNNQTLYDAKAAIDRPQPVNNQSLYDAKAANDKPQLVDNQTLYDAKVVNDKPQSAKADNDKPQLVYNQSLYDTKATNNEPQFANNQPLYAPQPVVDNPLYLPQTADKMYLCLGYQRTGSSYFADVLFNFNPDIHYIYEPLDQLYSSMYGLTPGWTVPGDITITKNGQYRNIPKDEFRAVTEFLGQLLTCDVSKFKTQFYAHSYWDLFAARMVNAQNFTGCILTNLYPGSEKYATRTDQDKCMRMATAVCGRQFDPDSKKQAVCKQSLWTDQVVQDEKVQKYLTQFKKCRIEQMKVVTPCVQFLYKSCTRKSIRAVKTVRATMLEAEDLLQRYPQLKVVHLLRDPRAVVESRRETTWSRNSFEADSKHLFRDIAHSYCVTALEDYRTGLEIQKRYPGRLITIWFDDFARDPVGVYKRAYKFLGLQVSDKVLSELNDRKTQKILIETIDKKWRRAIKEDSKSMQDIAESCRQFEKETNQKWFKQWKT